MKKIYVVCEIIPRGDCNDWYFEERSIFYTESKEEADEYAKEKYKKLVEEENEFMAHKIEVKEVDF